tara:strand:- start:1290 stop:2126 length:837 start_codon:yes stop_codon:yes gene_type:complete
MQIKTRTVTTNWNEQPDGLTWYFIGQPKTGKTTAAANWSSKGSKGVLMIDTDLGADFVDGANVVTVTSLNPPFEGEGDDKKLIAPDERGFYHRVGPNKGEPMEVYSLYEVYKWIKSDWKELGYQTLVIDTIDTINEWIQDAVCDELGISAMGQGDWGADWGKARRKNVDIVKRLQLLMKQHGSNLVLTSHSKQSQMNDGKVQLSPELPRGLGYALCARADVIGYSTVQKDETVPRVSFQAYDERTVGSRLKPLNGKLLPFTFNDVNLAITEYKEEEEK